MLFFGVGDFGDLNFRKGIFFMMRSNFLAEIRELVFSQGQELGDLNAAKLMAIEGIKAITPPSEGALLPGGVFRCGMCGCEHDKGPVSGVGNMYFCAECRGYRFIENQGVKENQSTCAEQAQLGSLGQAQLDADFGGGGE
jgi:hypothetical protein